MVFRYSSVRYIIAALEKNQDEIVRLHPAWKKMYENFPASGSLCFESLCSFFEKHKKVDMKYDDSQSNEIDKDDNISLEQTLQSFHDYLFSIKTPRDIKSDDYIIHEILMSLFKKYRYIVYVQRRINTNLINSFILGKIPIPVIYIYIAVRTSYKNSTEHEIVYRVNQLIGKLNKIYGLNISMLDEKDIGSDIWKMRLKTIRIDTIFIGVYVILNYLEEYLDQSTYKDLQKLSDTLVNLYYIQNPL